MAHYSYKEVCHRDDFNAVRDVWANECNGGVSGNDDPGYDGDEWYIASYLLDQKDSKIKELQDELEKLRSN